MSATPRLGPRPLALHLAAAQATWRRSALAWSSWSSSSRSLNPPPSAVLTLASELEGVEPDAFAAALESAIAQRTSAFLQAVIRYRQHPYRRTVSEPPVIWQQGSSRLLDFGSDTEGQPPLLLIPSLINRAYILDLMQGRSFARWLASPAAAGGFRPLLLDWGEPGDAENGFTLTDYVAGRLESALDAVLALTDRKPLLLGYCMGGLLTMALAQRRPGDLAGLALLATPWDFHAGPGQAALGRSALHAWSWPMDLLGVLPVDAVQALFTAVDPLTAVRKFRRFAALDPESREAEVFVALEDWLNDGVALTAPVARECLGRWYVENAPRHGRWRIAGQPVQPAALNLPTLCVIPAADRIVPPASALALSEAIPAAAVQRPSAGHIGMMASAGAEKRVWHPLATWLAQTEASGSGALRGGSGRSKVKRNVALRRGSLSPGVQSQGAAQPGRKRRRSKQA